MLVSPVRRYKTSFWTQILFGLVTYNLLEHIYCVFWNICLLLIQMDELKNRRTQNMLRGKRSKGASGLQRGVKHPQKDKNWPQTMQLRHFQSVYFAIMQEGGGPSQCLCPGAYCLIIRLSIISNIWMEGRQLGRSRALGLPWRSLTAAVLHTLCDFVMKLSGSNLTPSL